VGPQWFIVRTNNRKESLARMSLKAEKIEVYLPMIALTNKKGDVYGAPMFTNFLFAHLVLSDDAMLSAVFSARGVAGVLGNCGRPSAIADVVIHRIRLAEHGGYVQLAPPKSAVRHYETKRGGVAYEFKAGDKVTVKVGPLAGIEAVFVHDVDGGRNSVLIRLLTDSPKLARIDPGALVLPSRT
jgi:transcription antitermination factor NusG